MPAPLVLPAPSPPAPTTTQGSTFRLARALNSAIYDVKWDYESDRAIARITDFYVRIAVFYNKFMLLCPIL